MTADDGRPAAAFERDSLADATGLRFTPSRVEGVRESRRSRSTPTGLELRLAGRWVSFKFEDIAAWPRPVFVRRHLARLGWRPRWLPSREHRSLHPPSERFFRFYTWPPIAVYIPAESEGATNGSTLFHRVQDVLSEGGFATWDLESLVRAEALLARVASQSRRRIDPGARSWTSPWMVSPTSLPWSWLAT